MKKNWIHPEAKVQEFVANEYVAACNYVAKCNGTGAIEYSDGQAYNHTLVCTPCDEYAESTSSNPAPNGLCGGVPVYIWGDRWGLYGDTHATSGPWTLNSGS